jgi:multiple sugar transport system permease protein
VYYLVIISLSTELALVRGGMIYPESPSLDNFLRLIGSSGLSFPESGEVRQALLNSVIVASAVMILTMAASLPAGYALGRLRIKGRTAIVAALLGTRAVPVVTLVLPYYFLFSRLRLRGTIVGVVTAHLSITVPIVAWILMGFFIALPRDLEQMGRIDGCTRSGAFRRVLLPLAAPGIAAGAIVAFLFSWNDYLFSWLLTSGTPSVTLNSLLDSFSGASPLFASAVVLQILLPMILATFLQRYIVRLKIVDPNTIVI